MIDAVTYDFWNTVVAEVAPSVLDVRARLIGDLFAELGLDHPLGAIDSSVRAAWSDHRRDWAHGRHLDTAEVARRIASEFQVPSRFHERLVECLEYLPPVRDFSIAPGLSLTLEHLRRQGVQIGLICDTGFSRGVAVRTLLAELGLLEYFAGLTFSDEVGAVKPDCRMFDHASSYLRARAAPAHVGDLRRSDVAGAHGAGWVAVRYAGLNDDQALEPEADFVIYSHEELVGLVG